MKSCNPSGPKSPTPTCRISSRRLSVACPLEDLEQPVNKVTRRSRARRDGGRVAPPPAPSAPGSARCWRPAPEARATTDGGRVAPSLVPSAPGSPRCWRPAPEARATTDGGRVAPSRVPSAPGSPRCWRPAPEARATTDGGRVAPSRVPSAPGSPRCWRPAPEARATTDGGRVAPSRVPSAPGSPRCWRPAPETSGDPSRLNRPPTGRTGASLRLSLRFGRNTLGPVLPVGAPPSRALSAGPPPGGLAPPGELGLAALGAHATLSTGCQ